MKIGPGIMFFLNISNLSKNYLIDVFYSGSNFGPGMVNCINLIIEMSLRFLLGRENVPCVAEVVNRSLKADCTDFTDRGCWQLTSNWQILKFKYKNLLSEAQEKIKLQTSETLGCTEFLFILPGNLLVKILHNLFFTLDRLSGEQYNQSYVAKYFCLLYLFLFFSYHKVSCLLKHWENISSL